MLSSENVNEMKVKKKLTRKKSLWGAINGGFRDLRTINNGVFFFFFAIVLEFFWRRLLFFAMILQNFEDIFLFFLVLFVENFGFMSFSSVS